MTDIADYQGRILTALDKISSLATDLATKKNVPQGDPDAGLKTELDHALRDLQAEQSNVQRLNADIQALNDAKDAAPASLDGNSAKMQSRIENMDLQIDRLKAANAHLRESIGRLREKNIKNLGDDAAIDESLRAELEALQVLRAAEVGEMDNILEELKPLVEGRIDA